MGSGRRRSSASGCPRSSITEEDGEVRTARGTCRPRGAERRPPLHFLKRALPGQVAFVGVRHCELWLFVLILGITVPGAAAIITLDQVRRWMQRAATCFCLMIAVVCALAVYKYIWFTEGDDDADPWEEYEDAWEAELEAERNRTKMEKLRLQQEEYERQQKLKEQSLMKAMANGTNCSLVNELRVSMNQSEYFAFLENSTGLNVSDVNFTDPCPLNLTWLVGWAARTNYEDSDGPCANLVADQRSCALTFVEHKCDFVKLDVHDEVSVPEEIGDEEAAALEQEEEEAKAKAAEDWDVCSRLPRFDLIERCGESVCNSVCSQIESCVPIDYYLYGCAKDCSSICSAGEEAEFEGCFGDCAENTCPDEWETTPLELLELLKKPERESQRIPEAVEGPRRRLRETPGTAGAAEAKLLHKGNKSDHAVVLWEEGHGEEDDLAARMIRGEPTHSRDHGASAPGLRIRYSAQQRPPTSPASPNPDPDQAHQAPWAQTPPGLEPSGKVREPQVANPAGVVIVQDMEQLASTFSGTTSPALLRAGQAPTSFVWALLLLVAFWRSFPWAPLCRGAASARRGRGLRRTA